MLTPGVSAASFTVDSAAVDHIGYFLIPDGNGQNAATPNGPVKVIQTTDGSWAVAKADASGNVVIRRLSLR